MQMKGMEFKMKTKFTKLLSILLIICMAAALTACAQTAAQQESTAAPSDTQTEVPAQKEEEASVPEETVSETADEDVDGELILDHEEELQYASKFTLTYYKGGYRIFTIPEAMGDTQYLLVPEGKSVPAELPENTVVLQQPLTRIASAVTAGVSLIDAIDGLDNIAAVATKHEDWDLENVSAKMAADEIK